LAKRLVEVTHGPSQRNLAGKKQQTGGCNSEAVAMPDGIDKRELPTTTDSKW